MWAVLTRLEQSKHANLTLMQKLNRYTGSYEQPDERLMRSVEEKIDSPEGRKDDFRREIMNYIGAHPDEERLMRSVEEKIDIPEGRKDYFRRPAGCGNSLPPAHFAAQRAAED